MTESKTLLERALEVPMPRREARNNYTLQDVELVEAWLDNTVTTTQVLTVLGKSKASGYMIYQYVANVIEYGHKNGLITFNKQ